MDLTVLKFIIHYGFHFIIPGVGAKIVYNQGWKKAYLILLATMLIDIDHLWANPIYDPNRCSVGFHLLHSDIAISMYLLFIVFNKTRLLGVGLTWHIITDAIDCLW